MARSVNLERPPRLLNLPHERACVGVRGRVLREIRPVLVNTSGAQRGRDTTVARARRGVGRQATVRARERLDGVPCLLKTFAEQGGRDVQDIRGFGTGQLENL